MCDFITLIAPSDDRGALSNVMARHNRNATPIDNRSVSRVLHSDERKYLTTREHCDCGTVLSFRKTPQDMEAEVVHEAAKLMRKGWSRAKIERVTADRLKAADRPTHDIDSIALWADVVDDLLTSLKLPHVGLLVHHYSGDVSDEVFEITRRDAPAVPLASLETMQPDEVLVFRNARGRP